MGCHLDQGNGSRVFDGVAMSIFVSKRKLVQRECRGVL